MINIDPNIGKQAKDIAEAANTTVDTVEKAASFIDSVFGKAISNSIGLLSDKLAYYRLEKAVILQETVDKKLQKRGVQKRYVPVSFGLPIIEKATIEEDPLLQDKWANLLANARDETYDKPLRRNYSTMLADMEPIDAQLLDLLVSEYINSENKESSLFDMKLLVKNTNTPADVLENAVRNLIRLGLFKPGVVTGGVSVGEHRLSSYKDTEMFGITPMGVDFFNAVNDDTSPKP